MIDLSNTTKHLTPCKAGYNHTLRPASYNLGKETVEYVCDNCGFTTTRTMSNADKKRIENAWEESDSIHDIHRIVISRTKDLQGIDLIDEFEKLEKEYPSFIRTASCDDNFHSSSIMAFVEHKTDKTYMGTTVYVCPQNRDPDEEKDPFHTFFLYPGEVEYMIKVLQEILEDSKESRDNRLEYQRSCWPEPIVEEVEELNNSAVVGRTSDESSVTVNANNMKKEE